MFIPLERIRDWTLSSPDDADIYPKSSVQFSFGLAWLGNDIDQVKHFDIESLDDGVCPRKYSYGAVLKNIFTRSFYEQINAKILELRLRKRNTNDNISYLQ